MAGVGAPTRQDTISAARRSAGSATKGWSRSPKSARRAATGSTLGAERAPCSGFTQEHGISIDGIEPTPARRDAARQQTSAKIYDRPLEDLNLPDSSYAAIFMVKVFSHLFSPSATFAEIHRLLVDGGIVVWTSEFGFGVKPHHMWDWALGDHLQFLGEETIERYADRFGFELVERERAWLPDVLYFP